MFHFSHTLNSQCTKTESILKPLPPLRLLISCKENPENLSQLYCNTNIVKQSVPLIILSEFSLKKKKIIILYYISLSGMLKYEALGANFSSWEFDSAVASWGNGEIGEGRVLTQLKSDPLFSLTKLENMFSRFPSSLIFCFLWSQISVSASLYNCTASGCHIVYKLGRVQPRSGSPAGSPREAQCCRNALCASSTSGTALTFHHFAIQRSNPR